jgi:hypothetical protein
VKLVYVARKFVLFGKCIWSDNNQSNRNWWSALYFVLGTWFPSGLYNRLSKSASLPLQS